jgi:hypothetical protein
LTLEHGGMSFPVSVGDGFGGRGMLRAAVWTGGLFAVGGGICHMFPAPFVEPLVLLGLGTALFFVSGRAPLASKEAEDAPSAANVEKAREVTAR